MEPIEVSVMVTLQVVSNNPDAVIDRYAARVTAARAVQNAMSVAENEGFIHPMDDKVSISVIFTELVIE